MLRMMMMVALVGACVGPQQNPRWPDHRKQHDAKLDALEQTMAAQEAEIAELKTRLAKLETQLPPRQ